MFSRFACALGLLSAVATATAAENDRQLKLTPARGLGVIESVKVYQTKDGKRETVAEATKFDKSLALPGEGPFEVVVKPKGGVAVRVVEKLAVKPGETYELKVADVLGAVEVFGDNLPRAGKVVVTDVKDPGPGQKGHAAVQVATDYRVGMLVRPGVYAVWVVPAGGARPQRVVENVRVQAGRGVRVGE
jgi:hypothetical protein